MTKASDLFIECLEEEGCEYIFGIPGEENLDFLDSLSRSKKIKLVLTRHEQGAGFMASVYGRLTGKTGVCLSTLGPGATNFTTAAAYAQLGGMPMLMITGQKPVKSSKQGRFQILNVVEMMRPITKYATQIVAGDNIPSRVREAFRIAEEEKPGATHIELPEDIADEQTDERPIKASSVRRPTAEEKSVFRALEKIHAAKSPILVIGAGGNRKLTSKMLSVFIEKTGIPFIATQLGKGVIDERHPLFMGCAALSAGDYVHRALDAADLIINVGHDVIEKPPFFMERDGTEVIHVSYNTAEVDPVYFPQVEVIGDIGNSIWQLKNGVKKKEEANWDFSRMMDVKIHGDAQLAEGKDDMRFPIYPQHLVSKLRDAMPEDGIICLDNGVYKIWFARNYPGYQPNTVLLDNALATMGAGLPSAMAAHLVHPDRKVMAICGDGGFMMNSQELETAVRLKMNIVVLILNDSSYGMIRWKQANMGLKDWGLEYGNPDFVKYVEAYGGIGHRVGSAEELPGIIETALTEPGVHLIDCPVDYAENDQILNIDIKKRSAAI
ncbi:MAG: acetolactate synthase large subunit [Rhodospirillaceae bacterium]|nr:acetolactate synthase large subunit [Rhodospirillaceae bacterium]